MDLLTETGFANALYHTLNLDLGSGATSAPVCSTFVFMNLCLQSLLELSDLGERCIDPPCMMGMFLPTLVWVPILQAQEYGIDIANSQQPSGSLGFGGCEAWKSPLQSGTSSDAVMCSQRNILVLRATI